MTVTVVVRVLALHIGCDACGATARIVPDCHAYAAWALSHLQPRVVEADVLVNGVLRHVATQPA